MFFPFPFERERRRRSDSRSRSRDSRRSPRTPRREEAVPAKAVALPPLPPPTTPPPMMPAPGFMWQQVPIPGAASAPAQGYPVSSHVWPAPWKWQQQQWPQRQSWSQRKGGWNKYKREDSQSSKPGDDSWRNIKEASREEVRAAEERRAQAKEAEVDDDGDYLRALWQSARDEAQADPNRPPSAAELVKKGTLQSWGDIRVKFPDVGEYESFLLEVGRLATVLAAFKHFDRPLEGESPVAGRVGPELISFDLPGQNVLAMMCTLKFPEYVEDESCVHPGTFCHGTSFSAAVGIAEHGGVAVSHHSGEAFPSYGFFRARIPGTVLPGVADLCSYKNGNPLEVPRRGARACGGDPPSVNSLGRGRAGVHALDVQGLRQCRIGRALLGGSTPCNLAGHSCRVAPIEDRGIRL